jgi:ketosteroid isomerase-like protein
MLERLRDAQNSHDAERLASLFAEDYASFQPLHGGRAFVGRTQVLENWTAVFEGIPDFVSELVSYSIDGNTEWGEWYWHGRHLDGSSFAMRGVGILVVRAGLTDDSSRPFHRSARVRQRASRPRCPTARRRSSVLARWSSGVTISNSSPA